MVSVIVPIYNTEKYLDQCIASILGQSYKEIECILLNDGSTDRSLDICRKWEERDARIVLINKENEGQGRTRNMGICMAKGEYILFVDSDDFIEKNAIRDILLKMESDQSELCIFSYYACEEKGNVLVKPFVLNQNPHHLDECESLLAQMSPILCNKMYMAKLLKTAKFSMENTICEDLLFLPQLYVDANRISTLDNPYYYYRVARAGNMSTNYSRYVEVLGNVERLFKQFVEKKELDKYWREIFCISFDIFKDILFRVGGKRVNFPIWRETQDLYPIYLNQYEKFLEEKYGDFLESRLFKSNFVLIGSYNLRVIIRSLILEEKHLKAFYGASCIESFMSDKGKWKPEYIEEPENEYRESQIQQDISGSILHDVNLDLCDYIVMDFLEQTNCLLDVETGYVTVSEFAEKRIKFDENNVISYKDSRRKILFQKYAARLVKFLKEKNKPVILIENYFNQYYSAYYDTMENFENPDIKEKNEFLRYEYELFKKLMPEVIFVSTESLEALQFTQKDFHFGCKPEYYNGGYYRYVALLMGKQVKVRNEQTENL